MQWLVDQAEDFSVVFGLCDVVLVRLLIVSSLSCSPYLGGLPLPMNVRILLSCSPYPCITEQCWKTIVPLTYVMVL